MPTEKQIYDAATEAKRLAKKLGVRIIESDELGGGGNRIFRFLYNADMHSMFTASNSFDEDDVPARFSQSALVVWDFGSIFEILGYLRAIDELEAGRLEVYSLDKKLRRLARLEKKEKKAKKKKQLGGMALPHTHPRKKSRRKS